MADRNGNRNILALATIMAALFLFPAVTVAQAAEDLAFGTARESAAKAAYTISKVQRWLHEMALKKIEPDTGLYHPDGNFQIKTVQERRVWAGQFIENEPHTARQRSHQRLMGSEL